MAEPEIATIHVEFDDQTISVRYFKKRRGAITDIFQGRSYKRIPFIDKADVVVDVGASVGAASLYFSTVYPDAAIYAFEPHKPSFDILEENIKDTSSITPFNFGLSDSMQEVPLYIGSDVYSTNSIGKTGLNTDNFEIIKLEAADEVLKSLGIETIDILKVDTEGCEIPILRTILSVYTPRVIYFEYHSDEDRRELDRILDGPYVLFSGNITNHQCGDLCYVAKSAFPSEDILNFRKIVMPSSA